MISIQIEFYANTSQRPILKEIGLILNNKIRKWRLCPLWAGNDFLQIDR